MRLPTSCCPISHLSVWQPGGCRGMVEKFNRGTVEGDRNLEGGRGAGHKTAKGVEDTSGEI